MPTETLTPVPTLTTVPSPTPALIGICQWNNGSKHWKSQRPYWKAFWQACRC
jgi:hypothetical protein